MVSRIKKSTSFNTIDGSRPMSRTQRLLYLLINSFDNAMPSCYKKHFKLGYFKPKKEHLTEMSTSIITESPSRVLSNLFWRELPWDSICDCLGSIRVLDIGCGKGGYYNVFTAVSSNRVGNYVGMDIYENDQWKKFCQENVRFIKYDGASLEIPTKTNLIITQSAIEHFESDLDIFKQISEFINSENKEVIQIHLFLSAESLGLFLWHGYRQYSKRKVAKIVDKFDNNTTAWLYEMGGKNCNDVHWRSITYPLLTKKAEYRKTQPKKYTESVIRAIQADSLVGGGSPSFYALIMHSNPRRMVFNEW